MSGDGGGDGDAAGSDNEGIAMGEIDAVDNETSTSNPDDPGPAGVGTGMDEDFGDPAATTSVGSAIGDTLSLSEAISEGYKNAAAKDPGMMALTSAMPGMGILSFAAALANAPEGSLAGDGSSDPDPGGEAGEVGGPAIINSGAAPAAPAAGSVVSPPAEPVTKETSTGAVATPSADPPAAPSVTPNRATAAPGTLLRRRRRTQTILTSPQGVLGGAVSTRAGRRTRSLPRKTLLGG